MVGRDKLYFSLKRQYGLDAPTQKAINDWLFGMAVPCTSFLCTRP